MKRAAWLLVCAAFALEARPCTRSTSFVRVTFHHCAPLDDFIQVRVSKTDVALRRVDGVYEGQFPSGDINETYEIELPKRYGRCCWSAKKIQRAWNSRDCVVAYVVSCDDRAPGWSFTATSDVADLTFEFDTEHIDDFGDAVCTPTEPVRIQGNTIQNLGAHDQVRVKVKRNGRVLVSISLNREDLEQEATPFRREKLEELIDAAAMRGADDRAKPARSFIEATKALLPNVITVERQ